MPKGKWTPPPSGKAPKKVKKILKTVYASCRDGRPSEKKEDKSYCAAVAWEVAERKTGYKPKKKR